MAHIYEIELRSFLTPEKYEELLNLLPTKMNLLNKESLNTRKFQSSDNSDIRLRYSENRCEIVHKNGKASKLTRKEITINLPSKEELDKFAKILEAEGFEEVPPWTTHRMDFKYPFKGYNYDVSLQHTENFAHILEVEFASENEDEKIHEENIKEILASFECEPIDKDELMQRIKNYKN